eukprot:scaffold2598_cov136-Cylindrotheca_fusiformis.AAC.4
MEATPSAAVDETTTTASDNQNKNSGSSSSPTTTTTTTPISARNVYEQTGDSAAALELLKLNEKTSFSTPYNEFLCQSMVSKSELSIKWMNELKAKEEDIETSTLLMEPTSSSSSNSRLAIISKWIMAYNRGLCLLMIHQPNETWDLIWPILEADILLPQDEEDSDDDDDDENNDDNDNEESILARILNNSNNNGNNNNAKTKEMKEFLNVACHMALLLLQAVLEPNFNAISLQTTHHFQENVRQTLDWLQTTISDHQEDVPLLQFLLSLITSRMELSSIFISNTNSSSNSSSNNNNSNSAALTDHKVRTARKDLKQAMEIFQHKLKTTTTTTTETTTTTTPSMTTTGSTTPPPTTTTDVMQSDNQEKSALNLKANTERLKGNVKKSLILLGEAKTDDYDYNEDDDNGNETSMEYCLDQMHHYNNLALVYYSDGKPNLALHAWSKALSFVTPTATIIRDKPQASAILQSNGTPQSNHQITVLYNAGITCLSHQKYQAAYECMAIVVKHWASHHRPDCWLRLAEACIGWHAQNQQQQKLHNRNRFQTVQNHQGDISGIVLQCHNSSVVPDENNVPTSLAPVLGSPQDIEQVHSNPLPRAKSCLKHCLDIITNTNTTNNKTSMMQRDKLVMSSAKLSMSYVCLEQREYKESLKYAQQVLEMAKPMLAPNQTDEDGDDADICTSVENGPSKQIIESTIQRQVATARMYGTEASCALGDPTTGMSILVGDDEGFIDRLASGLAGVTLEEAATNPEGKARLAKAQAIVRCNASIVSAELNQMGAAKQLAMSAQAMEGVYHNTNNTSKKGSSSSDMAYAKRALIYCMLREGNSSAALQILRSVR